MREVPLDFLGLIFMKMKIYIMKISLLQKAKNQAEKDLARKMWNKVEKPYTYYAGYEIWRDSADHIQLFTFVLLIIIGFFSSGIIAQDKEWGLDESYLQQKVEEGSYYLLNFLYQLLWDVYICIWNGDLYGDIESLSSSKCP